MSDIALVQVDNAETGPAFDFKMTNGDLALDNGLITPVAVSLFCDRLAATDDEIPDGSTNRRGWWGDMPLDGETTTDADLIGTRLWLLERSTLLDNTRSMAVKYTSEALAWMIRDTIVATVTPRAVVIDTGKMRLTVAMAKNGSGRITAEKYDYLWTATL